MKATVFGLGKVGLPWALFLQDRGLDVYGVDANPETVEMIRMGLSPISEPGVDEALERCPIQATTDPALALKESEISFIYVPTPETPDKSGLSARIVRSVWDTILDRVSHGGVGTVPYSVVVCSTLQPGTLEQMWVENDMVDLFYAPPLVALGHVMDDQSHPSLQILGARDVSPCLDRVLYMYMDWYSTRVRCLSWTQAEVAKLSINIELTQKTYRAHEYTVLCDALGVDPVPVLSAMGLDPRIGPTFFKPGPPPSGPCLPRDVRAMRALMVELGLPFSFLCVAERWRALFILDVADAVAEHGQPCLILGMDYKADYSSEGVPSLSRELYRYMEGVGIEAYTAEKPVDEEHEALLAELLELCPTVLLMENDLSDYVTSTPEFKGKWILDPWRQLRGKREGDWICWAG